MSDVDQTLAAWRAAVADALRAAEAEQAVADAAFRDAEIDAAAACAAWDALSARICGRLPKGVSLASALSARLTGARRARDEAVGNLTRARLRLINAKAGLADLFAAEVQLATALAPAPEIDTDVGPVALPRTIPRTRPLIEVQDIIEFRAPAA
jgi:hypothetical protein